MRLSTVPLVRLPAGKVPSDQRFPGLYPSCSAGIAGCDSQCNDLAPPLPIPFSELATQEMDYVYSYTISVCSRIPASGDFLRSGTLRFSG